VFGEKVFRHNPEDLNLNTHRRAILKIYFLFCFFFVTPFFLLFPFILPSYSSITLLSRQSFCQPGSDPGPPKYETVLTAKKLNSVALDRERTMPTERPPLVGEVVPTFADRGCCVVSATDFHGR
jgi:hypothetical protein